MRLSALCLFLLVAGLLGSCSKKDRGYYINGVRVPPVETMNLTFEMTFEIPDDYPAIAPGEPIVIEAVDYDGLYPRDPSDPILLVLASKAIPEPKHKDVNWMKLWEVKDLGNGIYQVVTESLLTKDRPYYTREESFGFNSPHPRRLWYFDKGISKEGVYIFPNTVNELVLVIRDKAPPL